MEAPVSDIRTLVVYYSRTGNSRAVAEKIADSLGGADVEEIRDTVDRAGLRGYWRSFRDALGKREATLAAPGRDVSMYDLVIVGGPVWVGTPSSPVRSWLRAHARELHAVGFFLTHGGSARDRVLAALTAMTGRTPVAVLSVREREIGTKEESAKIAAFAGDIRRTMSPANAPSAVTERATAG
jgi:flavodoxin